MTSSDLAGLKKANAAGAVLAATTRLLREGGLEEVAQMAQLIASDRRPKPLVAVIGEEFRGKTAIIQQLAPHDSTEAVEAAAHSLYRYVRPVAAGDLPDGDRGPASRLPHWILADGRRSTQMPGQELCIGIEFQTPAPPTGGVEYMEAPARGGLDGAQGRFNATVVDRADVVVFVTDGGALLSQLELEYLKACSRRVQNILVAVARADLFADVDQVVQGNKDILQRHSPGFQTLP